MYDEQSGSSGDGDALIGTRRCVSANQPSASLTCDNKKDEENCGVFDAKEICSLPQEVSLIFANARSKPPATYSQIMIEALIVVAATAAVQLSSAGGVGTIGLERDND
jgi:hypothetical protein